MQTPQEHIEALVNKHFPKPVKVELTFQPRASQWTSYENKIGLELNALDAYQSANHPEDAVANMPSMTTVPKKIRGYLGFPRGWEESFSFENKEFKGGVYYDCVKSVKVL